MIYPYRFTDFIWNLHDLQEMENYAKVIVLDISNFLYVKQPPQVSKKSINIHSIYHFFLYLRKIKKLTLTHNVCILNNIQNNSHKEVLCNLIILFLFKGAKIKAFDMYNGGSVLLEEGGSSHRSVKAVVTRFFSYDSPSQIWRAINRFVFKYIALKIPTINTHRLVAGLEWEKFARRGLVKGGTIVYGHSYDYSRYVKSKKYTHPDRDGTAVFLSDAGLTSSDTDSVYISGGRYSRSPKKWFGALENFFDFIEKETKVDVQIAGHYKSNYSSIEPLFGNRNVFYDQTLDLIYKCDYVITINSTAISYAIALNKPILFIYSDELERERLTMNSIKRLSSRLDVTPINIDNPLNGLSVKEYLAVDNNRYNNYKYSALTSKDSDKPNYKIILRDIMGINTD
jgi:hypothetical protein